MQDIDVSGTYPRGIWSDGATMWVSDEDDNKVYAYELSTGTRLAHLDFNTFSGAGNNAPDGLWSDGTTMWVIDRVDDKLYAYTMPGRTHLKSLELDGVDPRTFDPASEAFDPSDTDYAVRAPSTTAMTTVTASALYSDAEVSI
ncbi:hypothetical protein [Candidatus Poriferisodalis sp.]|uniref:hypothetical protein n=1 Tax=Candidatus Poriferisodalis sp. TaxID=3101277 RepID=UPI003C703449